MPKYDEQVFRQSYEAIANTHAKRSDRLDVIWNFEKKVWLEFDLLHNLNFLVLASEEYDIYRRISFSAVFAWIIEPDNQAFLKSSVSDAVLKILGDAENQTADENAEIRFFSDMMSRVVEPGPHFYKKVYYIIGGLSDLIYLSSRLNSNEQLKKRKKQVARALLMMKILHFSAEKLQNRKIYNPPSQNLAISALNKFGPKFGIQIGLSVNSARNWWKAYEPSMILIYAADQVRVPARIGRKPSSLLDAVLNGHGNLYTDAVFIKELIARAVYIRGLFAQHGIDTQVKNLTFTNLPPANAKNWDVQVESGEVDSEIRKHFIKSAARESQNKPKAE